VGRFESHGTQSLVRDNCCYIGGIGGKMNKQELALFIYRQLEKSTEYVDGEDTLTSVTLDGYFDLVDLSNAIIQEMEKRKV